MHSFTLFFSFSKVWDSVGHVEMQVLRRIVKIVKKFGFFTPKLLDKIGRTTKPKTRVL